MFHLLLAYIAGWAIGTAILHYRGELPKSSESEDEDSEIIITDVEIPEEARLEGYRDVEGLLKDLRELL